MLAKQAVCQLSHLSCLGSEPNNHTDFVLKISNLKAAEDK